MIISNLFLTALAAGLSMAQLDPAIARRLRIREAGAIQYANTSSPQATGSISLPPASNITLAASNSTLTNNTLTNSTTISLAASATPRWSNSTTSSASISLSTVATISRLDDLVDAALNSDAGPTTTTHVTVVTTVTLDTTSTVSV